VVAKVFLKIRKSAKKEAPQYFYWGSSLRSTFLDAIWAEIVSLGIKFRTKEQ
jgi:hypothetical protein